MPSSEKTNGQIHVMLADDSAVIRGALARIIEKDPSIKVVSSVSNGEMAISSAMRNKPHIIILDIEMPVMDGLTALPKILQASPGSKVIMFSSLTEQGASVSLKAYALGAVECLVKPGSSQQVGEGSLFQKELLETIKGLVPEEDRVPRGEVASLQTPSPVATAAKKTPYTLKDDTFAYKGKPSIIAIGSSTGGPQALFEVIPHLKNFDIPIVITQHMPPTFTKILAQHIQQNTGIPAQEGAEGMVVEKGKIYVAPGGFHMHLVKDADRVVIHLDDGPLINFCKPAVDPMFKTTINIYGNKVLGVILTGMGHDGRGGGQALAEAGGRLVAQDEATSVVWGMPGAVAQAGLCSQVLPLKDIGPWVRRAVKG